MSAILLKVKLHKQTSDTEDDIKLEDKPETPPQVSCIHANSLVEFSEKLHPARSFPKALFLVTYKPLCVRTKGQSAQEKGMFVKRNTRMHVDEVLAKPFSHTVFLMQVHKRQPSLAPPLPFCAISIRAPCDVHVERAAFETFWRRRAFTGPIPHE